MSWFKFDAGGGEGGPSREWIDGNSTICSGCGHRFVDLTALKHGGPPHSTSGDPEGEGSACAFCIDADRANRQSQQTKRPEPRHIYPDGAVREERADSARIEMLESKGVDKIYFRDGSEWNLGSMSLRSTIDSARRPHERAD